MRLTLTRSVTPSLGTLQSQLSAIRMRVITRHSWLLRSTRACRRSFLARARARGARGTSVAGMKRLTLPRRATISRRDHVDLLHCITGKTRLRRRCRDRTGGYGRYRKSFGRSLTELPPLLIRQILVTR